MTPPRPADDPLPAWTGLEGLLALRHRIVEWIAATGWVEGAALFGSTERTDRGPDAWSDLDVLLVVAEPHVTIEDATWPAAVGEPWISLVHDAPVPGVRVRQVLYSPGHDVDWVPISWSGLATMPDWATTELAGHGARVLKDPAGSLAAWIGRAHRMPAVSTLPTRDRFVWTVDDLLYQAVWTIKRLRRGEVWRAKDDVDRYLKVHLLTMLEWHALTVRPGVSTFPEGRGLERWADPAALARVPATFATYDRREMVRAVLATLDLFADLSRTVARAAGWTYPEGRHATVVAWISAQGRLPD